MVEAGRGTEQDEKTTTLIRVYCPLAPQCFIFALPPPPPPTPPPVVARDEDWRELTLSCHMREVCRFRNNPVSLQLLVRRLLSPPDVFNMLYRMAAVTHQIPNKAMCILKRTRCDAHIKINAEVWCKNTAGTCSGKSLAKSVSNKIFPPVAHHQLWNGWW